MKTKEDSKVKELVEEYETVFNTVVAENIKGEVVMVRNEELMRK